MEISFEFPYGVGRKVIIMASSISTEKMTGSVAGGGKGMKLYHPTRGTKLDLVYF